MTRLKHPPPGFSELLMPRDGAGNSHHGPANKSALDAEDAQPDDEATIHLLAAILQQAALDLMSSDERVRDDAQAWFESDERRSPDTIGGIAFGWICEAFGFDQSWFASRLRDWASERRKRRSQTRNKSDPGGSGGMPALLLPPPKEAHGHVHP